MAILQLLSLFNASIVNLSLFKDIVETHPGLEFLREAPDFHSRYIHTVSKHVTYLFKRASQYLVGIKFSNLSVKFVYFSLGLIQGDTY